MARKTHGQKAARHTATALAVFDTAVSGLNEANRLLDLEAAAARSSADVAFDEYLSQLNRQTSAVQARRQNVRVLENIQSLVSA